MSMEGRKISFKRYNSQSNQNQMEGAIKNEQDLFEDPIIEKVPYKLVCPQPLHPLAQRSEVVEDFFINTNGAFLLRGNSDVQQPCGLQPSTGSNLSACFGGNMYNMFTIRNQSFENSYLLPSNGNFTTAEIVQKEFKIYRENSHNQSQELNNQLHIINHGIRLVCEIDMLLLKQYYAVKEKIFAGVNQNLPIECHQDNAEWIKQRFQFRYSAVINNLLSGIVDKLESIRRQKVEQDEQPRDQFTYNVEALFALCNESGDLKANEILLHKIYCMIDRFLNSKR